ncbi:hypothetical protein [Demequina salsinemoris]|uniref:hypothetical protein n=1 Tax=Demequina salsinemoris TaxID=577470 RepID=UPI0007825DFB|nr:hypothetical protein [Demequina salsinemoris]
MTKHPPRDDEFEAALQGPPPGRADMAVLSEAFDAMRRTYAFEQDDAHTAAFAGRLAAVAAVAPLGGGTVGAHPRGRTRMQRRAAAAIAAAAVITVTFGGVAAANEAAPGDALYGLDRALERLGVNAGGAHERLLEMRELLADGDVDDALDLSVEAVDAMDDLDEAEADELTGLLHAAESVMSNGSEQSAERRAQVAAMLTFMAETDLTGREFGQAVSQHARGIVDDESDEAATDDTTDAAPGNSGTAPGHTKDADATTKSDKSKDSATTDDADDESDADEAEDAAQSDDDASTDDSADSGSSANRSANSNAGGASDQAKGSQSNAGGNSDAAKESHANANAGSAAGDDDASSDDSGDAGSDED